MLFVLSAWDLSHRFTFFSTYYVKYIQIQVTRGKTQDELSLLFGDGSSVLVYRNTCWGTTALYTAKLERNCSSPAAWDLHCARRAGIHRENPKEKAEETTLIS